MSKGNIYADSTYSGQSLHHFVNKLKTVKKLHHGSLRLSPSTLYTVLKVQCSPDYQLVRYLHKTLMHIRLSNCSSAAWSSWSAQCAYSARNSSHSCSCDASHTSTADGTDSCFRRFRCRKIALRRSIIIAQDTSFLWSFPKQIWSRSIQVCTWNEIEFESHGWSTSENCVYVSLASKSWPACRYRLVFLAGRIWSRPATQYLLNLPTLTIPAFIDFRRLKMCHLTMSNLCNVTLLCVDALRISNAGAISEV